MPSALDRLRRAKERFGSSVVEPEPSSNRLSQPQVTPPAHSPQPSQTAFRTPSHPAPSDSSPESTSAGGDDYELLLFQIDQQYEKVRQLEAELQTRCGVESRLQDVTEAHGDRLAVALDKVIKEKKLAQLRVLELEDEKRAWEAGAKLVVTDKSAGLVSSLSTENDSLRRSVAKLKSKIEVPSVLCCLRVLTLLVSGARG